MTTDDNGTTETQRNLNESADKIRLSTKVKRGTGTRDQDTHTLKARGETPAEAAENLSDALAELEERDVFERAREVANDE
jgi:2'-5' RNA ligase